MCNPFQQEYWNAIRERVIENEINAEEVTVYAVEYPQVYDGGLFNKRVNWINLATFWSQETAEKIAAEHPNHRVVIVHTTVGEADQICED